MSDKQFVLVVYDISNDRRRTRLHNALLDFGTPVQYSVFECLLSRDEKVRMKKAVFRVISKRRDSVRIYSLCAECVRRTEVTTGPEVFAEKPVTMVT